VGVYLLLLLVWYSQHLLLLLEWYSQHRLFLLMLLKKGI
jgi:hypothetical protein